MTCFSHVSEAQSVILAALIAAVVGSLSWLGKSAVSAVLWFYGRLGREAEMLVALKAEIGTAVDPLGAYTAPNSGDPIKAGIAAQPNYKIFIPLDRDYFIFDRVKPDISLLPEAPIREIVEFYDDMGGFDTLVGLLQEPRFESFPAQRRIVYVDDMIMSAAVVVASGNKAKRAIDGELWNLAVRRYAKHNRAIDNFDYGGDFSVARRCGPRINLRFRNLNRQLDPVASATCVGRDDGTAHGVCPSRTGGPDVRPICK